MKGERDLKKLKKPANKVKNYQIVTLNKNNECPVTKTYCPTFGGCSA